MEPRPPLRPVVKRPVHAPLLPLKPRIVVENGSVAAIRVTEWCASAELTVLAAPRARNRGTEFPACRLASGGKATGSCGVPRGGAQYQEDAEQERGGRPMRRASSANHVMALAHPLSSDAPSETGRFSGWGGRFDRGGVGPLGRILAVLPFRRPPGTVPAGSPADLAPSRLADVSGPEAINRTCANLPHPHMPAV